MAATESSTRAMAALDDLYRQHVGDVYRYTYAVLGNHADAEDVTQTTFVNALRALERGETPREPSHWLLAIAHNLVRQRWRQAANRPAMVELVHDVPDEGPDEEDVQLDELVRALQRIPPSQREALVMRELEGRSYVEIAELLGLTTGALETLLFRARRSLAEEIENLVTCQSAELALSKQSDGRLSRKERKRLDEHLAECPSCAAFAKTQARQRRAFKGLAMLPVPVGLALFRDVPAASAATVTHIGSASVAGTGGVGAGGTTAGGGAAGGAITAGGTVAGGSLLGGVAVKIAAVIVIATFAVGAGYKGVTALGDGPSSSDVAAPANGKAGARTAVKGATAAAAGNLSASKKQAASRNADNSSGAPGIATKGALPAGPETTDPAGANGAPSAADGATSSDGGATAGEGGGSPGSGPAPGGSGDTPTAAAGDGPAAGGSSGSAGGSVAAAPRTSGPSTTPKPTKAPATKGKAKGKSRPKPKPKPTAGTPPNGGGGTKPTKPETPTAPGNGGAGGGSGSPNGNGNGGSNAPNAPNAPKAPSATEPAAPPAPPEAPAPAPPTANAPASPPASSAEPSAGESTTTDSGGAADGQKNENGWGQGAGGGRGHKG